MTLTFELSDDELDAVVGGYEVGQMVQVRNETLEYCPGCGKMMTSYEATITDVRGALDGNTVYWVTYNCCGRRASVAEDCISG